MSVSMPEYVPVGVWPEKRRRTGGGTTSPFDPYAGLSEGGKSFRGQAGCRKVGETLVRYGSLIGGNAGIIRCRGRSAGAGERMGTADAL